LVSVLSLLAMLSVAQGQLVNGNFAAGDFTGWTLFNTSEGGSSLTQVVQFDTAGTGVPQNSAEFEVGQTSGQIGGGPAQGSGILQFVTLGSGQLTINLNVASYVSDDINEDGGTFELLLDSTVVSSFVCGPIGIMGLRGPLPQTIRSTLNYSGTVQSGTHEIAIEIIRVGAFLPDVTPFEYLSNISLSGTAVPEPSSLSLFCIGLVIPFFFIRRWKSVGSK